MEARKYQKEAMRTNDGKNKPRLLKALDFPLMDIAGVLNASLGLSGEVGELNDMIKKAIFHGHIISSKKIKKEIGDICWYIALMCDSFGFDLNEIMEMNIEKLKARYPEGFSEFLSQNRKEGDE